MAFSYSGSMETILEVLERQAGSSLLAGSSEALLIGVIANGSLRDTILEIMEVMRDYKTYFEQNWATDRIKR